MASNGHGTNAVPNGTTTQLSHRPQTPAYTIGNQFVAQYYMVLHNTPDVLHRFYTDDSTVTHSDCGSETEPSSSVTVTTQKDIRQRMQDMNFTETKTEIWSVDSQYSSQNGVMVLVTGLMEIKGKKQRDFIQSFFLATQEKGYYVLNDTLRFLSNRYAHQSAQPKENYSTQHNQALQTGLYHQPQPAPAQISSYYTQDQQQHSQQQAHHAPYPGSYQDSTPNIPAHVPISNHLHHQNVPAYATSQRKKPVPIAPPTHNAQFEEAYGRESLDKQEPAQPPKPTPAAEEPPKPTPAPAPTPTPPAEPPKEEPPKPAQVSAQPEKKPEPVSNPPVPIKAPAAEKPAEKQKPAEPPAPLTYADRLRMNAAAASQKATASSSANRVVTSAQQPRPAQASRPSTSPPIPSSEQPSQPAEPQAAEPAAQQEPTSTTSPPELSISGKEEEVLTSIFVRNLPDDITAEKLQEVFSEFGTIKNGLQGINLKQQKHRSGGASGSDFAFVDFEEQSAMQAAIAAKVVIDEKPVTVMERRPLLSRGYGSRGGRGDGRGFRGRSEGRGRGGRDSRPHTTGGRSEAREPRPEGGRGGRGYEGRGGEGGRGRGDRGRGRYGGRNGPPPQSSAAPRQQAAEA